MHIICTFWKVYKEIRQKNKKTPESRQKGAIAAAGDCKLGLPGIQYRKENCSIPDYSGHHSEEDGNYGDHREKDGSCGKENDDRSEEDDDRGKEDDNCSKKDDSNGKENDNCSKKDDSNGKEDGDRGKDGANGKENDDRGKETRSSGCKEDDNCGKEDDSGEEDDNSKETGNNGKEARSREETRGTGNREHLHESNSFREETGGSLPQRDRGRKEDRPESAERRIRRYCERPAEPGGRRHAFLIFRDQPGGHHRQFHRRIAEEITVRHSRCIQKRPGISSGSFLYAL